MSTNYASIEDVKEKLDINEPIDVYGIYKGKQKKLRVKEYQNKPEVVKRRNELEAIRRIKLREEDPEYFNKINEKSRARYAANPEKQIAHSTKWNKNNKEKRNATNRKSYAKNRKKICAKVRERRRKIKETKNA